MVHWWHDPAIEARLSIVYEEITFLLLGIYGWEYFQSFCVEYAVIRGRLPFRWPLVPYLFGRISLLTALVLLAIETSPLSGGFPCQPGITALSIPMGISIGTSSTNLMIRTWVMWKDSRLVHVLLSLLALGHWTILVLDVVNIKAFRSNGACVIHITHPAVSSAVFMYTACYDFIVLVLSILKLSKEPSKSALKERLRAQGLSYFTIATMANILPTVFAFLGSDVMVGISGNPAITASIIVSCRAVRSLLGLRIPRSSHTFDENDENAVLTTQLPNQTSVASIRSLAC
ncbi:hypothetical protein OG21DRAFT_1499250 [Imleria badia]|nr:hypothetical protein OG21DRAFT_1499250 [Imleria badia]